EGTQLEYRWCWLPQFLSPSVRAVIAMAEPQPTPPGNEPIGQILQDAVCVCWRICSDMVDSSLSSLEPMQYGLRPCGNGTFTCTARTGSSAPGLCAPGNGCGRSPRPRIPPLPPSSLPQPTFEC